MSRNQFFPQCNSCCEDVTPKSYFLSCGHFLCHVCNQQQSSGVRVQMFASNEKVTVYCVVCKADVEAIVLGDGGQGLPQTIRKFVTSDTADVLSSASKIIDFQMGHYEALIKVLKTERTNMISKLSQMQLSNQSKQKIIDDQMEQIQTLKSENATLKQNLSHLEGKSTNRRLKLDPLQASIDSSCFNGRSPVQKSIKMRQQLKPNISTSPALNLIETENRDISKPLQNIQNLQSPSIAMRKVLGTPLRKQIFAHSNIDHPPKVRNLVVARPLSRKGTPVVGQRSPATNRQNTPTKKPTHTPSQKVSPIPVTSPNHQIASNSSPSFSEKSDLFSKFGTKKKA
jgi:hypothetical protein